MAALRNEAHPRFAAYYGGKWPSQSFSRALESGINPVLGLFFGTVEKNECKVVFYGVKLIKVATVGAIIY